MMFHHLMQTLPARIDITPKIRLLIFQRPHLCLVRIQHKIHPIGIAYKNIFTYHACGTATVSDAYAASFQNIPVNGLAI